MDANVIAGLTYYATLCLGIAARVFRRRFGMWHHVMFGVSCVTLAIAVILEPSPIHVLPAIALLVLPATRPHESRVHDLVATVGAISAIFLIL